MHHIYFYSLRLKLIWEKSVNSKCFQNDLIILWCLIWYFVSLQSTNINMRWWNQFIPESVWATESNNKYQASCICVTIFHPAFWGMQPIQLTPINKRMRDARLFTNKNFAYRSWICSTNKKPAHEWQNRQIGTGTTKKNDDNNYYLFACGQITNHSRRCPMLIWLNRWHGRTPSQFQSAARVYAVPYIVHCSPRWRLWRIQNAADRLKW